MACIIDSWVPTASITECAPNPLVSSLILATPSSPRSVTISVAPNSRGKLLPGLVAAHRNDSLRAELLRG
jgi:hypothetical protein